MDPPDDELEAIHRQEVWALTGNETIQARIDDVITEATSELILLVVEKALLTAGWSSVSTRPTIAGVMVIIGSAIDAITDASKLNSRQCRCLRLN